MKIANSYYRLDVSVGFNNATVVWLLSLLCRVFHRERFSIPSPFYQREELCLHTDP